ncbi:MAG: lipoate--protein ligase family protein [Chlamydiota bacterium]|nr:lipoate--protein ligase family protein [Chlamydiota bacterium]
MDFHILELHKTPIWEQLQIEEALLRSDNRNWCVINRGSPPAIVMGISGKPEVLLNASLVEQYQIPVWKRFSGGGTVVIDENTLFVTFICNTEDVGVHERQDKIHSWAESVYREIFPSNQFRQRENDYVLGDRKFGGNAQYLRRGRWLHHTSFLWDFDIDKMQCLLMPPTAPDYRVNRSHDDFLCRLNGVMRSSDELFDRLKGTLASRYTLSESKVENVFKLLDKDHRKATKQVEL